MARKSRNAVRPKRMIVKVQASLYTDSAKRQVLVYNEDQSMIFQGDLTDEIAEALGDRPKAFFYATITPDRKFGLDEEAPWQSW